MACTTNTETTKPTGDFSTGLSTRGQNNVDTVMSRIPRTILEAGYVEGERDIIDMSVAENWLIRHEILEIQREVVASKKFGPEVLSWPKGFWGDPELLRVLAIFFNTYFKPHTKVLDTHISLAPGVAHTIDSVLFNICDPGDGVLCPAPYWNGYDTFCRLRPSVTPILVPIFSLSDESSFLPYLESTFTTAQKHQPIRALMISNPHNPLGRCFSRAALESCLKFCQGKGIHLISDEIFGPFTFDGGDQHEKTANPFVSVLSIDLHAINVDPSRVHILWGPSKVFAMAGLRIGCIITQFNIPLRNALTLSSLTTISSLSATLLSTLLTHPRLPQTINLYATRLSTSYKILTSFLIRHSVLYHPASAGPFVLAKLVVNARSVEDETKFLEKLRGVKVWVSPGRSHHLPEHEVGWVRITFAFGEGVLREGLKRIEGVLEAEGED